MTEFSEIGKILRGMSRRIELLESSNFREGTTTLIRDVGDSSETSDEATWFFGSLLTTYDDTSETYDNATYK